jgi:DNA-directed RNA polymerase specialized sigma24 family protein
VAAGRVVTATVPPVAPQRRGLVPPETARRILAARDGIDQAEAAYRAEVLAALEAGASYRELAALTGTALSTIQKWKAEADRG